jgi:hypothetical protein
MSFHAARVVLRVVKHPDAIFFAMIVLTFVAFVICAAIEFTPDAGFPGISPHGSVDDADECRAGILNTSEG